MWRHAILEIYSHGDGWPDSGTPAGWIERGEVSWCNGRAEDVVRLLPLWRLLWWKVRGWVSG